MNVSEIKAIVQRSLNIPASTETAVGARVLDEINRIRRDLVKKTHWKFLQKTYLLPLVEDYETGTVSIDASGTVITGSGTTFTDDMVGRFINFGNNIENADWYRISKFTSTTSLSIDAPYQGSSNISGSAYTIRKSTYRVPGDVRHIEDIHDFDMIRSIDHEDTSIFMKLYPSYEIVGSQSKYTEFGRYARETTYTTGAVTCASNSTILISTGSSLIGNVLPGDTLTLGNYSYKIDAIHSATELKLATKLMSGATNAALSVTHNPDSLMIKFAYSADDNKVVPINYYHDVADFYSENDEDSFTRLYPNLIIQGIEVLEYQFQEDEKWQSRYSQWQVGIRDAIATTDVQAIWKPQISKYKAY